MYLKNAIVATALGLVASAHASVNIAISGFDVPNTDVTTYYLTYALNFFGEYTIQPTTNQSEAIDFDIVGNSQLESASGMSIGVTPIQDYSGPTNPGAVTFTNYTGSDTNFTYVSAAGSVLNTSPDWATWVICVSQYGAGIDYGTSEFNVTEYNSKTPFPCYTVSFSIVSYGVTTSVVSGVGGGATSTAAAVTTFVTSGETDQSAATTVDAATSIAPFLTTIIYSAPATATGVASYGFTTQTSEAEVTSIVVVSTVVGSPYTVVPPATMTTEPHMTSILAVSTVTGTAFTVVPNPSVVTVMTSVGGVFTSGASLVTSGDVCPATCLSTVTGPTVTVTESVTVTVVQPAGTATTSEIPFSAATSAPYTIETTLLTAYISASSSIATTVITAESTVTASFSAEMSPSSLVSMLPSSMSAYSTYIASASAEMSPISLSSVLPSSASAYTTYIASASAEMSPISLSSVLPSSVSAYSTYIGSASAEMSSISLVATIIPSDAPMYTTSTAGPSLGSAFSSIFATATAIGSIIASPSATAIPSSSVCPLNLEGKTYEYPHLIIPVNESSPSTAYGTQYFPIISAANPRVATIFNFDIPASYAGSTCSLMFALPTLGQLETSSYSLSGAGNLSFFELEALATQGTHWDNAPSEKGEPATVQVVPGAEAAVVASGPCAAGGAVSYEVFGGGDLALSWFQDWNPCPIGLFVVVS